MKSNEFALLLAAEFSELHKRLKAGQKLRVKRSRCPQGLMAEVSRLGLLARAGDERALRNLLTLADTVVDALNDVPLYNLEQVRSIARSRDLWPVHVGLHPDSRKTTRPFLEWLELGVRSEIGTVPRAKWSFSHVATQYCIKLINVVTRIKMHTTIRATMETLFRYIPDAQGRWPDVQRRLLQTGLTTEVPTFILDPRIPLPPLFSECATLPPLSKATAKQWWQVSKQLFLMGVPNPEAVPSLRRLVVTPNTKKARFDSEIHHLILAKMRRAFYSIAAR